MNALEDTRVSEYVVAEGPAAYLVVGLKPRWLKSGDKLYNIPWGLVAGFSLILPVVLEVRSDVSARIYDDENRFLLEVRDSTERSYSWATANTSEHKAEYFNEAGATTVDASIRRLAVKVADAIAEFELQSR